MVGAQSLQDRIEAIIHLADAGRFDADRQRVELAHRGGFRWAARDGHELLRQQRLSLEGGGLDAPGLLPDRTRHRAQRSL